MAPRRRCPTEGLRIVALGGLGEIGRNMAVFEYDGRLLIVDCGVLFPEPDQPGVDLILPDFEYIRDRLDDIEAVVLTHAHEDHIGAVPYLLRERRDIPLDRIQADAGLDRGQAHRAPDPADQARGGRGRTAQVRAVRLRVPGGQPLDPGRLAVAIRTPAGIVLHTGDFRMDQLPSRRSAHRPGRRSPGSAPRASTC